MFKEIINGLDKNEIINKKLFYIIFSVSVLGISLTGLNGSLQNVDEVLFARVSRESLENNSWLIQIQDGKPNFFKAPMVFWSSMLSFRLFGVSDFTARLPSAIANIITSYIILLFCVKIFHSYKTGIIAVFIYLCSLQVYASSHQICTDLLALMFLLLSIFFSLKGIEDDRRWFLLAGFFNGMAYLSKSALGIVIPITLFFYIIFKRRWDLFIHLVFLTLISLLFSIPYYLYVSSKLSGIFKENFLSNYLFKIVYSKGKHGIYDIVIRLFYYIVLLLFFILPFTPGIFYVFYRKGEEQSTKSIIWNNSSALLSIYLIVLLIGFSLIRQNMAHYTLQMIPLLSIFLGESLKNIKEKKIYLYFAALSAIVLAVFVVLYSKEGHKYPAYRDVVIGLVTIYSFFIIFNLVFLLKKVDSRVGVFTIVCIFFIIFTIHTAITVPLDFNSDIKSFTDVYNGESPILVVSTREVDEGSKTRVTIWYMKKRSKQYKSFNDFLKVSETLERGTYLIFYNGYTNDIKNLYRDFTLLKTGKIWSIGIVG